MSKQTHFALFGAVAIAVLTTTSHAYADDSRDGFYAGLAIAGSGVATEEGAGVQQRDNSKTSIGAFAGYKQKVYSNYFIAGEAFINDTSQDRTYSNGDRLSFGTQYGVKAHLGYEANWGSVYAILGAANLDYDVTLNGSTVSESGISPIFGLGTSYQINEKVSANLEYIGTGDSINIAGKSDRGVGLGVVRLGLAYHF
ncbi:porin family protein [Parasedimentitalea maritima]|uniref:Porin family protein n=1 Tax=Parasedimentitalea maritima TaxID=2578117 RepID=A0ABY2UZS9_9RHOB|nr:outer membrane beta-barrel protein [Zongyanglinia marina]TLP68978.1 porin family protein [Zongyanglinia marina]